LKADPDAMDDQDWARAVKGLEWARAEEAKHNKNLAAQFPQFNLKH